MVFILKEKVKIYKINSPDKKWNAEISPLHGANVVKLQYENKDVFVPLDSEEQLKINPYLQGSPILLPANRTYKGRFEFEGKEYTLPLNEPERNAHLHGLVHKSTFNVIDSLQDKIVLEFVNNGEVYPFDFCLLVTYILNDDGFYQYYKIINTGNCNMPVTFALHTTFVEPEKFCVPIASCQEKDENHIPTGRYVELNSEEKLYVTGSPSKGRVISGYYKSSGNTAYIGDIKYTVSKNFDHWILYNGQGESGLLCVEPQSGAVDGLNSKNDFVLIRPGEYELFETKISKR